MQDPSLFQQTNPQFPEHEQLKCPRCDSTNTKFCYYNNYNLSQPRHYCKNCRRYWTKGGSLRNIPVGGATRKATKRATSASKRSATSSPLPTIPNPTVPKSESLDQDRRMFLTENNQFRSLIEGLNSNGFGKDPIFNTNSSSGQNLTKNPVGELQSGNNAGIFLGVDENGGDSSYWGSSNGWPDLSIYTPRSTFQ